MAYTLGDKCTKNCKWTILVQLIIEDVATWFLPHDAMQARPMPSCSVCVSVCLCVLSCSCILSKRINISSKFFHRRLAKPI